MGGIHEGGGYGMGQLRLAGHCKKCKAMTNSIRKDKQDKINKILDKISEKGYSSLTKNEIDFLNKNK